MARVSLAPLTCKSSWAMDPGEAKAIVVVFDSPFYVSIAIMIAYRTLTLSESVHYPPFTDIEDF